MRYRKKPVLVDAIQFLPTYEVPGDAVGETIRRWLSQWDSSTRVPWVFEPDRVEIPTLEGVMRADPGDYIIRGVKGEFYPCKPDIFEATYEREDGSQIASPTIYPIERNP